MTKATREQLLRMMREADLHAQTVRQLLENASITTKLAELELRSLRLTTDESIRLAVNNQAMQDQLRAEIARLIRDEIKKD